MRLAGQLKIDQPNPNLYGATGSLSIGGDSPIKLDVKNLLLRGSVLKNTEWVIGVCAYTGKDTKIMKNSEGS